MPHEVVLGAVYTALKAALAGSAPLAALLATKKIGGAPAVYDEGEAAVQGSALPYVTVGAGTQVPFHTFGPVGSARYGWNCTVQVKVVSQSSEGATMSMLSAVAGVLYEGMELGLPGYATSYIDEFSVVPTLIESVAGVVTRSAPAIVRTICHD